MRPLRDLIKRKRLKAVFRAVKKKAQLYIPIMNKFAYICHKSIYYIIMPYRSFLAEDIQEKLGLRTQKAKLFTDIIPLEPGDLLKNILFSTAILPKKSEKARSEMIVFPILLDLCQKNNYQFIIYSGENLKADLKRGLNGECDFILSKNTEALDLNVPIFTLVEAKRDQIIEEGIPQCIAQLVGAQVYNAKKKIELPFIYGCVSTGEAWKFLKLEKDLLIIDTDTYYLGNLSSIIGVFQMIVSKYI